MTCATTGRVAAEYSKTHISKKNTPHLIIYRKSCVLTPLGKEQDKSGKGTTESMEELLVRPFNINVSFGVIHAYKPQI